MLTAVIAAVITGTAALFGAGVSVPDINVVLNVVALVALVWWGPRFISTKGLQAQLAEKDKTIATNDQTIKSRNERIDALVSDLEGAEGRADKLEERNRKLSEGLAQMQGRYEEQSRYTAREALITIEKNAERREADAERRHKELMAAMERIAPPPPRPA